MNLESVGQLTGNEALDDLVAASPMSILGIPLIGGGIATAKPLGQIRSLRDR